MAPVRILVAEFAVAPKERFVPDKLLSAGSYHAFEGYSMMAEPLRLWGRSDSGAVEDMST